MKKSGWEEIFYMGKRAGEVNVDIEFFPNSKPVAAGQQQYPAGMQ